MSPLGCPVALQRAIGELWRTPFVHSSAWGATHPHHCEQSSIGRIALPEYRRANALPSSEQPLPSLAWVTVRVHRQGRPHARNISASLLFLPRTAAPARPSVCACRKLGRTCAPDRKYGSCHTLFRMFGHRDRRRCGSSRCCRFVVLPRPRQNRVMNEDPPIRRILNRLHPPEDNIITRARRMVEREVPPERRGPGWDRHWRELEAYLDLPGRWSARSDDDA